MDYKPVKLLPHQIHKNRRRPAGHGACVECGADLVGRGYQAARCAPCSESRNRLIVAEWSAAHYTPEKYAAHQAVRKAKRRGALVRPNACERCSAACKPHAHHFAGYAMRNHLTVEWLCVDCHAAEHAGQPRREYRRDRRAAAAQAEARS